jgi:hypothetical protein
VTSPKPAEPQPSELTAHFKALVLSLRTDTLKRVADIVLALISAKSVNQGDLCGRLPGCSSPEAKKRRVERGLRDPQLTESVFLTLLLALLPPSKLLPSPDHTVLGRAAPVWGLETRRCTVEPFGAGRRPPWLYPAAGVDCAGTRWQQWDRWPDALGAPTIEGPSSVPLEGPGGGPGICLAGLVPLLAPAGHSARDPDQEERVDRRTACRHLVS